MIEIESRSNYGVKQGQFFENSNLYDKNVVILLRVSVH